MHKSESLPHLKHEGHTRYSFRQVSPEITSRFSQSLVKQWLKLHKAETHRFSTHHPTCQKTNRPKIVPDGYQ